MISFIEAVEKLKYFDKERVSFVKDRATNEVLFHEQVNDINNRKIQEMAGWNAACNYNISKIRQRISTLSTVRDRILEAREIINDSIRHSDWKKNRLVYEAMYSNLTFFKNQTVPTDASKIIPITNSIIKKANDTIRTINKHSVSKTLNPSVREGLYKKVIIYQADLMRIKSVIDGEIASEEANIATVDEQKSALVNGLDVSYSAHVKHVLDSLSFTNSGIDMSEDDLKNSYAKVVSKDVDKNSIYIGRYRSLKAAFNTGFINFPIYVSPFNDNILFDTYLTDKMPDIFVSWIVNLLLDDPDATIVIIDTKNNGKAYDALLPLVDLYNIKILTHSSQVASLLKETEINNGSSKRYYFTCNLGDDLSMSQINTINETDDTIIAAMNFGKSIQDVYMAIGAYKEYFSKIENLSLYKDDVAIRLENGVIIIEPALYTTESIYSLKRNKN